MRSELQPNLTGNYTNFVPHGEGDLLTDEINLGLRESNLGTLEEGHALAEAISQAARSSSELLHPPVPQPEYGGVSGVSSRLKEMRLWEQEMNEGPDAHEFARLDDEQARRARTAADFARVIKGLDQNPSNNTNIDYEATELTNSRR
jgi:hypothetical protein